MATADARVTIGDRDFQVHPVAAMFPDIAGDDYQRLREDIEAYGVRTPIVVCGSWFVDGRTRLRVCGELGIDAPFVELDPETDVASWIISANIHRRHLSTSQRAVLAALMTEADDVTLDQAASALNVSRMSVARARAVGEVPSEKLREAVRDGTLTVADAYQVREVEPSRLDAAVDAVRSGAARSISQALQDEPHSPLRESSDADGDPDSGSGVSEPELSGSPDATMPPLPPVGDSEPEASAVRQRASSGSGASGSGQRSPTPRAPSAPPAGSGVEWDLTEDLRSRAAAACGVPEVVDGAVLHAVADWTGHVLWCPRDGVLEGAEALFRDALARDEVESVVLFTRCVLDSWAQELLASPRLSAVAFGAGPGGVRQWVVTDVPAGPVAVWGFGVEPARFARAFEGFGAVVRVGR